MPSRTRLGALLLTALIALTTIFLASPAQGSGTTTVDANGCPSIGGSWSDSTATCTLSTLYTVSSDEVLSVPAGNSLVVRGCSCLTIAGFLNNQGNFSVNGGIITVYGNINNFGNGTMYNTGTVNVYSNGQLNVGGSATLTNDNAGIIDNSGLMTNNGRVNAGLGKIVTESGGSFVNYGTIYNGGNLEVEGTLYNRGVINTYGILYVGASGSVDNSQTIDNSYNVNNMGTITNECGAVFNNDSGSTFQGNDVVQTCTSTSTTSTTQQTSSETSTVLNDNSTSPGDNMTASGDVPEFAPQVLAPVVLTLVVVLFYVAVRSSSTRPKPVS